MSASALWQMSIHYVKIDCDVQSQGGAKMIRTIKLGNVFTNRRSQINIWFIWPASDYKDKKARVVYEHLTVNKTHRDRSRETTLHALLKLLNKNNYVRERYYAW